MQFPVSVGPTGEVVFEGRRYDMPPAAIGLPATLYLDHDRLRIVAGRTTAEHRRLTEPGAVSRLPEHRAQHVSTVSGTRGRHYLQRQHWLDLGPATMEFLSEVVHRRPRLWYQEVEVLHKLLQVHGDSAMRAAFERAVASKLYGVEDVRLYLERPMRLSGVEASQ